MYLFNLEFMPWLDPWMAKHKTQVVCFGAALCGLGAFVLTKSPSLFNVYIIAAWMFHYFQPRQLPSLMNINAYNTGLCLVTLARILETYGDFPHIIEYDDAIVTLAGAIVPMAFGLKCCELCGDWKIEQHLVQRIELCTAGVFLYAVAMGLVGGDLGDFWRYNVAFLVAVLVFGGAQWLDDGAINAGEMVERSGTSEIVEEKKGGQV